jgi:hypothetical protein
MTSLGQKHDREQRLREKRRLKLQRRAARKAEPLNGTEAPAPVEPDPWPAPEPQPVPRVPPLPTHATSRLVAHRLSRRAA